MDQPELKYDDVYLNSALYASDDFHTDFHTDSVIRDALRKSDTSSGLSKWAGKKAKTQKSAYHTTCGFNTAANALSDTESVRSVYSWGLASKVQKKWVLFDNWLKDPWRQVHIVGILTAFGPGIFNSLDDTVESLVDTVPIYLIEGMSSVIVPLVISTIGIEGTMVIGYLGYVLHQVLLWTKIESVIANVILRMIMGFLISCIRVVNTTSVFTFAGPSAKDIFIALHLAYSYAGTIIGCLITMAYSSGLQPYDPHWVDKTSNMNFVPFTCISVVVFIMIPFFWRPAWTFANTEGQRMSFGVPRNIMSLLREWTNLINDGLLWFVPQWFLNKHFRTYRRSYMCRLFSTVKGSLLLQIVLNLSKIVGLVIVVFFLKYSKQKQKSKMKLLMHFATVTNFLFVGIGHLCSVSLCDGQVDLNLEPTNINYQWADFPNQIIESNGSNTWMDGCEALEKYNIHVEGEIIRCVRPGYFGQGQLDWSNSVLVIDPGWSNTPTEFHELTEADLPTTKARVSGALSSTTGTTKARVYGSLDLDYGTEYTLLTLATIIGGITYSVSEFAMYWFVAVIAMSYAHRLTTMITLITFFGCMGKVASLLLYAVPGLLFRQQNYINLVFYFVVELASILGIEWTNRGEWHELVHHHHNIESSGSPSDRKSDWQSSYEYYYSYESIDEENPPNVADGIRIMGDEPGKSVLNVKFNRAQEAVQSRKNARMQSKSKDSKSVKGSYKSVAFRD